MPPVGFKHSEETKARISASVSRAMRGNTNGRGNRGRHLTAEHKAQISAVHTGRVHSEEEKRKRRESLAKTRYKPTKLERSVHAALEELDIQYVVHKHVQCGARTRRPDVYLPELDIYIEINGCYHHGCEPCYGARGLVERRRQDELRLAELYTAGCTVLVLWEHDIRAVGAKEAVQQIIRGQIRDQV